MSPPPGSKRRIQLPHVGALDGLRGLAVIAVILFHGGVSWATGGFLGVEIFFVLSGFLITSLLLAEWLRTGTISLPGFWGRRARRLLPALFLLVLVIGIRYAAVGTSAAVPGFWGDGLSALFYFSNWHQIAAGTSYFASSGPISPFQHTWSLSIEEQFYLVWPLAALIVFGVVRRRRGPALGGLRALLTLTVLGALASVVDGALLFDGGRGLDRVYYGTDTRASGLLAGAALAAWLALRRQQEERVEREKLTASAAEEAIPAAPSRRRHPRQLPQVGRWGPPLVLLGVLTALLEISGSDSWLYPWGFALLDLAVIALIATVVLRPGSSVDRVLALRPLQGVGRISYGLYLWHFPLFLWLDTSATGLIGVRLLALRLGVTLAVSLASYWLLEQPVRQRRLPSWLTARLAPSLALRALAPLGAGLAVVALLVGSAASSLPTGLPAAATLPSPPPDVRGNGPACAVSLHDTPGYGVAPVPAADEATFEYRSLGRHTLVWSGSAAEKFQKCPPERVMLIGDSIAFTIGLPMLGDEHRYGVELADASILGCAFSTRGELDVNGTWEAPSDGCPQALSTWRAQENRFHPALVVVELGYRDEFDWRWDGRVVHLGEPAYDRYLQAQMDQYVKVLGRGGTKILFLSVPYTHPPDQSDGAPAPAASPLRHAEVNTMLRRAAGTDPGRAAVVNLDQTISPGNHYDARVDGQLCRFDGIHFSLFCGELLERPVLDAARALAAG